MQKYFLIFLSILFLIPAAFVQDTSYKIITSDIDNFWAAYDSSTFIGLYYRA